MLLQVAYSHECTQAFDPLAQAKVVVHQCGAGSETGRSLGIDAQMGATLEGLVGVSGQFDAGYFSFVRTTIIRQTKRKDRVKAYEAYVDCVKALAAPAISPFDPEEEKRQGQIAERLEQLFAQTLELSGLVTSGAERQVESDKLLLQQIDAMKIQVLDLKKRAIVEPGAVRGEIAVVGLLLATRSDLAASDYTAANAHFQQALLNRSGPLTGDLLSMKAQILYGLGQYDKVAEAAQQALQKNDPPRSAQARLEDKRLLADALTRVGKGDALRVAVDTGVDVTRADLLADPPNISGAFAAAANAAQAAMRSKHGDADIAKLVIELDSKIATYSGPPKHLLYYLEALAGYELDRYIRLRTDAQRLMTRERMVAWWQQLDRLQVDRAERAPAAMHDSQFFLWTIAISPTAPLDEFSHLEARLDEAAQYYADEGVDEKLALARYALARFHREKAQYPQCISELQSIAALAPAFSAVAADIQALKAVCGEASGLANSAQGHQRSCHLARQISNLRERSDRVAKYCGGAE